MKNLQVFNRGYLPETSSEKSQKTRCRALTDDVKKCVLHLPFDPLNPYQRALLTALSELGVRVEACKFKWFLLPLTSGMDVVHIHWTYNAVRTPLWKFICCYPVLATQFAWLRLIGRRIVWTVHNLENHEKKQRIRDRLISLLVGHMASNVVVHGKSARILVSKRFGIPQRKIAVIPHGNYIGLYPNEIKRSEARRALGLKDSQRVLLFFGQIRAYKGVEELIEVFKSLDTDDTILIIAGRPINHNIEQRIRLMVNSDSHFQFHPGFVKEDQVQVFMNASDAVVFPYKDILTSGAVLLAMSFSKACIAPKIGCITDVLNERGSFLYEASNSEGLTLALKSALEAGSRLSEMGRYNRVRAEQWSWNKVAAATFDLYRGRMPENFM